MVLSALSTGNSLYTKTDLVFGFTRPRQNEYRAGERLTGRAGWKPNLGCGYPRTKSAEDFPRTKGAEDFTRSILYSDFIRKSL